MMQLSQSLKLSDPFQEPEVFIPCMALFQFLLPFPSLLCFQYPAKDTNQYESFFQNTHTPMLPVNLGVGSREFHPKR